MGCDKVLSYNEVQHHDQVCKYALVKCEAFKNCKTRCIRKEIEMHQSICPYFLVPCVYCLKMIQRVKLSTHEKDECTGSHQCNMCGLTVLKDEIQTNTHNCFNTLTQYLQKQVDEKDTVIAILKEELERKNKMILEFIEK